MGSNAIQIDILLTPQEIADTLKVSALSLANMRSKKEGPKYIKVGRLVRYRYREIIKYLEQNTIDPNE